VTVPIVSLYQPLHGAAQLYAVAAALGWRVRPAGTGRPVWRWSPSGWGEVRAGDGVALLRGHAVLTPPPEWRLAELGRPPGLAIWGPGGPAELRPRGEHWWYVPEEGSASPAAHPLAAWTAEADSAGLCRPTVAALYALVAR
jgi:hypothetical protein